MMTGFIQMYLKRAITPLGMSFFGRQLINPGKKLTMEQAIRIIPHGPALLHRGTEKEVELEEAAQSGLLAHGKYKSRQCDTMLIPDWVIDNNSKYFMSGSQSVDYAMEYAGKFSLIPVPGRVITYSLPRVITVPSLHAHLAPESFTEYDQRQHDSDTSGISRSATLNNTRNLREVTAVLGYQGQSWHVREEHILQITELVCPGRLLSSVVSPDSVFLAKKHVNPHFKPNPFSINIVCPHRPDFLDVMNQRAVVAGYIPEGDRLLIIDDAVQLANDPDIVALLEGNENASSLIFRHVPGSIPVGSNLVKEFIVETIRAQLAIEQQITNKP